MSAIEGRKVDDIDGQDGKQPGAYEIRLHGDRDDGRSGKPAGLAFRCPCGCGREGWLPFRPSSTGGPDWTFDGNLDRPTLTPSVLFRGGCRWHGYLTDGEWRSV